MKEKSTTEKVLSIGKAIVPILGYYSGRKEGFNDGIESVAAAAADEVKRVNDSNKQLRHDLLFDYNAFISPNGWDVAHWQTMVRDFIAKTPSDGRPAKDVLELFIENVLARFPPDRHFGETHRELESILKTLRVQPRDRMSIAKDDIELAIDFLDLFSAFPDEKGRGYVGQLIRLRSELLAAMDKSAGCNFLILGKTGSGKSALLNYLLGSNLADSGVGRPVTERGLHQKEGVVKHGDSFVKVHVFDSWGLEAGHYDEWLQMMDGEKQKRDFHHKITDWFHVVVYCIQASGSRVESVDTQAINDFLKDGFNVVVALTKVDYCTEEDEAALHKVILEDCPKLTPERVISVCSVQKEIRGVMHNPFGGDMLKKAITESYVGTLVNQLPLRCKFLANEKIDSFAADVRRWISTRGMWDLDNLSTLKAKCDDYLQAFNRDVMPRIVKNEINSCAIVSQALATTINVSNEHFKKRTTDFYEDGEPLWESVAKTVAAVFLVPVGALYVLFGGGSKMEREELNSRLLGFVSDLRNSVNQNEASIRAQVCKAFNYTK